MDDWIFNSTGNFGPDALFPISCCVPEADDTVPMCNIPGANSTAFEPGCLDAVSDFIQEQLLIVASLGIAFIVAEVSVITMVTLACTASNFLLWCWELLKPF